MSKLFRAPNGLPCRYRFESGIHIENNGLFGEYEILFTGKGERAVKRYILKAKELGFPNHIVESVAEKKLSHDQVTFYYAAMQRMGMSLDDIPNPDWHPRDSIFYGLIKKNYLYLLLLPLFYLICAASMFVSYRVTYDKFERPDEIFRIGNFIIRSKLSGELLWILRYECLMRDKNLRVFMVPIKWIIKTGAFIRFGGIKQMVSEYFKNDASHPIIKYWRYYGMDERT